MCVYEVFRTTFTSLLKANPVPLWLVLGCVDGAIRDFQIVDLDTGAALAAGQTGELCVRGPQVMKGYFNNPRATADTIRDGWLHTGWPDVCGGGGGGWGGGGALYLESYLLQCERASCGVHIVCHSTWAVSIRDVYVTST